MGGNVVQRCAGLGGDYEYPVVTGDTQQTETDDQHAGYAPPRKATSRAAPRPSLAACAVRTLLRTETFMPM